VYGLLVYFGSDMLLREKLLTGLSQFGLHPLDMLGVVLQPRLLG
jgi:hypothetical protein